MLAAWEQDFSSCYTLDCMSKRVLLASGKKWKEEKHFQQKTHRNKVYRNVTIIRCGLVKYHYIIANDAWSILM